MAKTVVLVTGANRGIGLGIVQALLESNSPYHIYLCSRDLEKGAAITSTLTPQNGNTVSPLQLDITSPASVTAAAAQVKAEHGRIDVLINNAGANFTAEDEISTMAPLYEINVIGPARLVATFKPLLLIPAEGVTKRIINVSSNMGSVSCRLDATYPTYTQEYTPYRCTKAALDMLTACQTYEFRETEVKVHVYDPGWAATELGGGDPKLMREWGAIEPLVSGVGCRDVVEGKRDGEKGVMVSVHGGSIPW